MLLARWTGRCSEDTTKEKKLSLLSIDEIKEILTEIESDSDSLNLMHAYLERERPEWEEVLEETGSKSSETLSSDMNEQQAFEILGLSQDASDKEIGAAHKRLMQGVHPDRGGSTFLAAKINAAKDLLLGRNQ